MVESFLREESKSALKVKDKFALRPSKGFQMFEHSEHSILYSIFYTLQHCIQLGH